MSWIVDSVDFIDFCGQRDRLGSGTLEGDVRGVLDVIDSEFWSVTVTAEKPILPRPHKTLGWWEYCLPLKGATWL